MSGIDRKIILDSKHNAKHLPNTSQVRRPLRRGRAAHVFNDVAIMYRVAQAIIEKGALTGTARGYERYGLFFTKAIGYRIGPDATKTPLYGEIKINVENQYRVIPRTRPSR